MKRESDMDEFETDKDRKCCICNESKNFFIDNHRKNRMNSRGISKIHCVFESFLELLFTISNILTTIMLREKSLYCVVDVLFIISEPFHKSLVLFSYITVLGKI